jgi:tetratricopeptide (TPR) repeat protein
LRGLRLAALVLAVAALGPAGATAGATASAVAALTDAGGQVVFDFPHRVGYSLTVAPSRVTVTFTEPFTGSLDALTRSIPSIVGRADLSPDHKVATLFLRGAYALKSQAVGASIILDLAASAATREVLAWNTGNGRVAAATVWLDPAPAAGTEVVADKLRTVDVIYSREAGFERLTFDWHATVPYRVEQGDGTARIEFEAPGRIDLPALMTQMGGADFKIDALPGDKSLVVTLSLPREASVRHALSGGRVVVDIAKGLSTVAPDRPQHAAGGTVTVADTDRNAKPAPAEAEAPKAPEGAVGVQVTRSGERVTSLRFDWPRTVGAAAFRRGRHVWLVFSESAPIALDEVRRSLGGTVFAIEQVPDSHATVLRLAAATGVFPVPRQAGLAWIVDFETKAPEPNDSIAVQSQPDADQGGRVVLRAAGIGQTLELTDPDAGDKIVVVPVGVPGMGIVPGRSFAEFRLLPTVQGIAVEPRADGISVERGPDGIVVTRPKGLRLSPAMTPMIAEQERAVDGRGPSTFDFAAWRGGPTSAFPAKFAEVKSRLMNDIATASPAERNARRLALAQFYFAHGFAPDALGTLRVIVGDDAEAPRDAPVIALRGASRFMTNDYAGAAQDLNDKRLDNDKEIGLWRGALLAEQGDWRAAIKQFDRASALLPYYPKALRMRFGLFAAEAQIDGGNPSDAQPYLRMLEESSPDTRDAEEIAFLRARLLAANGQNDAALDQWQKLEDKGHNPVRVKAAVARISLLSEMGKLDVKAAIDRLDRLRFAWRGDETEFKVLALLARLYLGQGKYREGLDTMKEADRLYPALAHKAKLRDEMSRVFAELFMGGGADRLPPVRALALFDDYKELAPDSAEGDAMIGRLADRLVSVDLLGRAAELLDHQVKHRLKGVDKAKVGARLALVRLLDRKPEAAIAALNVSQVAGIPADLNAERNRLKARAYADLGKPLEALAMLGGDTSEKADLLRVDIQWRAQNWAEAAQVFARLAKGLPDGDKPLTASQSRMILNWTVALALAGDKPGLAALRTRFDGPMNKSPYAASYRVIANEIERGGSDYASIVSNIAEVAQFQAFLANYRERLEAGGLSKIN